MPRRALPTSRPAALLALCVCACTAWGQTSAEGFTPVDPGYSDVSSLRTSLRQISPDLRTPSNFDRVFRIPGSDRTFGPRGDGRVGDGGAGSVGGIGFGDDRYARINGAIIAVFPRSEYVRTRNGVTPQVPTNTTFYIGRIPSAFGGDPSGPRIDPNTASLSVSTQVFTDAPVMQMNSGEIVPTRSATTQAPGDRSIPTLPSTTLPKATKPGQDPVDAPQSVDTYAQNAAMAREVTPPTLPARGMLSDESYRRVRVRDLLTAATTKEPAAWDQTPAPPTRSNESESSQSDK